MTKKSNLNLRVLLVDDEDDLRETLKEMLELYGLRVEVAINGSEAYEKTKNHIFDLIISDIRMPQSTGVDFLNKLTEDYKKKIPILMVSAYSDYDENSLKRMGARKLLHKPINMATLLAAIEQVTFK
ncbi:MAG: response regulator [Bdellovibrionaceae bacterium]|nr:response regulator [Pseudobdellovibrionaceae bacterium]